MLVVLSIVYSVVACAFEMMGQPLAMGEFFETSTSLVTLIMVRVGQVVSAIARQRAIEVISIHSLQECTVCIMDDNNIEHEVDARLLHYDASDTLTEVLLHSTIVTDGEVVTGNSSVDELMVTGESRPVEKALESTVGIASTLLVTVIQLPPGENTTSADVVFF